MTLIDPKLNYATIRDGILSFLRTNYTTLNTNLTHTITNATKQIVAGDPVRKPIPTTLLPIILLKIVNKNEDFIFTGNAGRKRPILNFTIFVCVHNSGLDTDTELSNLVDNIEGLFRNNINISDLVLQSSIGSTEFGYWEQNNAWNDIAAIQLACLTEIK